MPENSARTFCRGCGSRNGPPQRPPFPSSSSPPVGARWRALASATLGAPALLGRRRSAISGRHYRNGPWEITTLDGKPYPDEDLPFSRVGRTGEASYGVELALKRRDGTRVILSINSEPPFDGGGN